MGWMTGSQEFQSGSCMVMGQLARIEIAGSRPARGAAARHEIRRHVGVTCQHGVHSRARRPTGDWQRVQPRARLIGRIPGPSRVGEVERAYIAGDLISLLCSESVEHRPRLNRVVGIIEILQIAAVGGVAIRAMRMDRLCGSGEWRRQSCTLIERESR